MKVELRAAKEIATMDLRQPWLLRLGTHTWLIIHVTLPKLDIISHLLTSSFGERHSRGLLEEHTNSPITRKSSKFCPYWCWQAKARQLQT
jgi:hypothetical protein